MGYVFLALALIAGATKGYCGKKTSGFVSGFRDSMLANMIRMLLCIAIVLEITAKLFIPELPFGGQVTLVSMLPIVLISYRHGVKWGFVASFTYALLEMALGAKTVSAAFLPGYFGEGRMILNALAMCFMDYIAAFTVLGLGGIFRNRIQNRGAALACGSLDCAVIEKRYKTPETRCSAAVALTADLLEQFLAEHPL